MHVYVVERVDQGQNANPDDAQYNARGLESVEPWRLSESQIIKGERYADRTFSLTSNPALRDLQAVQLEAAAA